jgi:hypothetical protein
MTQLLELMKWGSIGEPDLNKIFNVFNMLYFVIGFQISKLIFTGSL